MTFKVPGYCNFHENPGLNFMLNRMAWIISKDELEAFSRRFMTMEAFISEAVKEARACRKERKIEGSIHVSTWC